MIRCNWWKLNNINIAYLYFYVNFNDTLFKLRQISKVIKLYTQMHKKFHLELPIDGLNSNGSYIR